MEMTPETGDAGTATLMVHLLGRCNLTCRHCYMEGAPTRTEQLPISLVLGAVEECRALGIASLYLTGGEPLLYHGIEDVLRRAAEVPGLGVTLCTNATVLRERHVELLREIGAKVNVSVDGDADFHDGFRGMEGAFQKTERGVRLLTAAGIPVTIVSTISRANLEQLRWLVEWSATIGAVQFRAQPLLRLGRGGEIADLQLSKSEIDRMLLHFLDLANVYRERGLKCNIVGASRSFLRKHACGAYVCNGAGCHRRVAQEIKKLVIREDGTVLPEVTNLNHSFAVGTIYDGPLVQQVNRFFEDGYQRFDRLCRTLYNEVVPAWESEFIPWDQLVAERSQAWQDAATELIAISAPGCGTCDVGAEACGATA